MAFQLIYFEELLLLIRMDRLGHLPDAVLVNQGHQVSHAKAVKFQYNFCNHIICRFFDYPDIGFTVHNFSPLFS